MNFKRFILRAKLHKVHNMSFELTLLTHELLRCELVQGYISVEGATCWHIWLNKDNQIIDPTLEFMQDKFGACECQRFMEKPTDRVVDENQDFITSYELYVKNPRSFWEQCDEKFKKFRQENKGKLLKLLV